jgi:hypothetical protein
MLKHPLMHIVKHQMRVLVSHVTNEVIVLWSVSQRAWGNS